MAATKAAESYRRVAVAYSFHRMGEYFSGRRVFGDIILNLYIEASEVAQMRFAVRVFNRAAVEDFAVSRRGSAI